MRKIGAGLFISLDGVFEELYDLKVDPHEETNLAADPKQAAKLREMKGLYAEYLKNLPPPVLPREKKKK